MRCAFPPYSLLDFGGRQGFFSWGFPLEGSRAGAARGGPRVVSRPRGLISAKGCAPRHNGVGWRLLVALGGGIGVGGRRCGSCFAGIRSGSGKALMEADQTGSQPARHDWSVPLGSDTCCNYCSLCAGRDFVCTCVCALASHGCKCRTLAP